MLSPASKRIVSPSKQLSSSPRGNKHGRRVSGYDLLCAAFLRYFRWLMTGVVCLSFIQVFTMEPLSNMDLEHPGRSNHTHHEYRTTSDPDAPSVIKVTSPSNTRPSINRDSSWNEEFDYSTDYSEPQKEQQSSYDSNADQAEMSTIATAKGLSDSIQTSSNLLSSYRASNAPVILDGWDRTVQVHLIVDVTGSTDVDPASKLLHAAVERSEYTQLKAVTFVRPSVETFEMFPRNPKLPLLFLIDWGSMDRDCHRLQLVLEHIRMDHLLSKNKKASSQLAEETEEPYFLLIDSSGSTRQTGCNYLFQNNNIANENDDTLVYAHTNDINRIRLAKRSIVQNRYYDLTNMKIHTGEVAPNQWDETPSDYNQPVLQSSVSLRESFVMGIDNITDGEKFVPTQDKKRPLDVGYFWKSGDYSHYGFYRRDIAKVVKTLHHSTLNKKTGRLMENEVGIMYTDEKEMEAGYVQIRYIERILLCKIVVVTQRDEWEDHFRLMESLASGALVMTDSMVALPEGFEDKVNIVVYKSPKMLKDLIKYYLKPENKEKRKRIAQKGYKLAMGRHRCWHRLEELLFGRPLTHANQPYAEAPPKEKIPGYA